MTLIFGANLQDCVYLGCDTRLTTTLNSGIVKCEDDFLKYHQFSDQMFCVAAGDAKFASFILQKIEESPLFKNASYDKFANDISQFIEEESKYYPDIQKLPSIAFIFAGTELGKNKSINMAKLVEFTKILNTRGIKKQRIHPSYIESMTKKAIANEQGGNIESNIIFSGLFGVQVQWVEDKILVTKEEAKWGEYLLYGEKHLHKEDVSQEYFIELDLSQLPENITDEELIRNNALLIAGLFEKELIPKHSLTKVGGSYFVVRISKEGGIYPAGDIGEKNIDGSVKIISSITHVNGIISTKIGSKVIPFRHLINFYKGINGEMSLI